MPTVMIVQVHDSAWQKDTVIEVVQDDNPMLVQQAVYSIGEMSVNTSILYSAVTV